MARGAYKCILHSQPFTPAPPCSMAGTVASGSGAKGASRRTAAPTASWRRAMTALLAGAGSQGQAPVCCRPRAKGSELRF